MLLGKFFSKEPAPHHNTGRELQQKKLLAELAQQITATPGTNPVTTAWEKPQFSENEKLLGHIFRKAPGHFAVDTPENRQYILEAVASPENFVGKHANILDFYLKIMPDGTQAWALVKNGIIDNGGCNEIPMKWVRDSSKIGGKLVPLQTNTVPEITAHFKACLQVSKLEGAFRSYPLITRVRHDSSQTSTLDKLKGVGQSVGFIVNLLDELDQLDRSGTLTPQEHLFLIPTPEGAPSLNEQEIQQILLELARGIYIHDSVPFISMHFNQKTQIYPVIHPIYQNSLIGYAMSQLDYTMKGFWQGCFYDDHFVAQWHLNPVTDRESLGKRNLDFKAYCQQHVGISPLTFDEILEKLEATDQSSGNPARKGVALVQPFTLSCRVVGKQKSIRKAHNLFTFDPDFEILYSFDRQANNDQELIHFRRIETAWKQVCENIRLFLPKLPGMRKNFEILALVNFFSSYFMTLKAKNKIPSLILEQRGVAGKVCPPLFPPVDRLMNMKIPLRVSLIFEKLSLSEKRDVLAYFNGSISSIQLEQRVRSILSRGLKNYMQTQSIDEIKNPLDYQALVEAL